MNPLFAMQGPLSPTIDWNPTPFSRPCIANSYSGGTRILHSLATLGSLTPHHGVGFQPSEGLDYRGWQRDTTVASR
ncbi:MAG: hypothetical protein V3T17_15205, partial [Pseudomonadales bacterium]